MPRATPTLEARGAYFSSRPVALRAEQAREEYVPCRPGVDDRILRDQIRVPFAQLVERHCRPIDRVHPQLLVAISLDVDHAHVVDHPGLHVKAEASDVAKPERPTR